MGNVARVHDGKGSQSTGFPHTYEYVEIMKAVYCVQEVQLNIVLYCVHQVRYNCILYFVHVVQIWIRESDMKWIRQHDEDLIGSANLPQYGTCTVPY